MNFYFSSNMSETKIDYRYKELYLACEQGDLEKIKNLVNKGVDIHTRFGSNYYPIEKVGELTIINYPYSNYYPIEIASENGHLEVVKWMYSIGCDVTNKKIYAMQYAIYCGHIEVVKFLYSIGCKPNDYDDAIITACRYGHFEVVKFLVSIGCNPTVENDYAIYSASIDNHLEIVKFLILVGCKASNIIHENMEFEFKPLNEKVKKEIELWLNWKQRFNESLQRIYSHPDLERTNTENLSMFNKNFN